MRCRHRRRRSASRLPGVIAHRPRSAGVACMPPLVPALPSLAFPATRVAPRERRRAWSDHDRDRRPARRHRVGRRDREVDHLRSRSPCSPASAGSHPPPPSAPSSSRVVDPRSRSRARRRASPPLSSVTASVNGSPPARVDAPPPLRSAAASVLSGFSFVPALASSPLGETNTPHASATAPLVGSQLVGPPVPPVPPSCPPVPPLEAPRSLTGSRASRPGSRSHGDAVVGVVEARSKEPAACEDRAKRCAEDVHGLHRSPPHHASSSLLALGYGHVASPPDVDPFARVPAPPELRVLAWLFARDRPRSQEPAHAK